MILQNIEKKEIWNSEDLIVYFALYLNPTDDRANIQLNNDKSYSLDNEKIPELFYLYENPNEWLELCKRFDCKSSQNATDNLINIVKEIAKAQNLKEDIFLKAIEENKNKFGKSELKNENANLEKLHEEQAKQIVKEQKEVIEQITKKDEEQSNNMTDEDMENIMANIEEEDEDKIPEIPKKIIPNKDKKE